MGGILRLGKRQIRKWQLTQLATELQHRGTDATGFALMNADGSISAYKEPYPAWKVAASKAFNEWADKALNDNVRILLVHTRAYTKGSPQHNENNHPLYAKPIEGLIVHNGMVRNDDSLFEINKKLRAFERTCATDSDVFRAIVDNRGEICKQLIEDMGIVEGTAAVAAIHRNSPGKLLLLRDSNPLVLGATSDTLAFASTKEALHKVLKPFIKLHNLEMQVHAPDLSFTTMPNETGYIFDINAKVPGLVEHAQFKCNGRPGTGYVKYGKHTHYWDKHAQGVTAAKSEKRFQRPEPARAPVAPRPFATGEKTYPPSVVNPTSKGSKTLLSVVGSNAYNDPKLFEYTICPNEECNSHVELSEDDRRLASIAYLACKSCGTNLAGGPDASMRVN